MEQTARIQINRNFNNSDLPPHTDAGGRCLEQSDEREIPFGQRVYVITVLRRLRAHQAIAVAALGREDGVVAGFRPVQRPNEAAAGFHRNDMARLKMIDFADRRDRGWRGYRRGQLCGREKPVVAQEVVPVLGNKIAHENPVGPCFPQERLARDDANHGI